MSSAPPDIDRGSTLEAAIWTQVAIALVFIILRFWARSYRKAVALDDYLMLVCWLFFLGSGVIIQLSAQNGGTRHFQYLSIDVQQYQLELVVICLVIAIPATWLGKFAIGITILRILGKTSTWKRWAVLTVLGITSLVSLADMFLSLFRCGNPRAQWDYELAATATCLPRSKTNPFNDLTNGILIFADYFFSILPMAVVWGLNMPLRKRIIIIILLGLTIITGAAGTVKMVLVTILDLNDITWNIYHGLIWYGIETMFIIVFGSLPAIHPLWERLFQFLGSTLASDERNDSGGHTGSGMAKYRRQLSSSETEQAIYHDEMRLPDVELVRLTDHPAQPQPVATAVPRRDEEEDWFDTYGVDHNGRIHVHRQVDISSAEGDSQA